MKIPPVIILINSQSYSEIISSHGEVVAELLMIR
jgi:hypothetical protein